MSVRLCWMLMGILMSYAGVDALVVCRSFDRGFGLSRIRAFGLGLSCICFLLSFVYTASALKRKARPRTGPSTRGKQVSVKKLMRRYGVLGLGLWLVVLAIGCAWLALGIRCLTISPYILDIPARENLFRPIGLALVGFSICWILDGVEDMKRAFPSGGRGERTSASENR